jgi:hypothetical protein
MGEGVIYAYGLCGIRPSQLVQEHFTTARMATNMMMGRWSSDGVNLWQVDLQTIKLTQGCATYQVPDNTIVMLDAYYTIQSGTTEIDRIMTPVSRSEYAAYPNKQNQGAPTVFWFDRLLAPTVTLWPVPNGQQACLKYFRLRQTQDSNFQNGLGIEIPYYFWDAFSLGLGYRLALTYAPDKVPVLKPLYDEAWSIASTQNTEQAGFYVSPMMSGYWRS